jgi:leader peptidase (prepilin peptidase)/N-methyltransferase
MIDMLAQSPALFIGTVFVLALLFGSFLNVVIYRLPLMMERDWREQCAELATQPASDIPEGRFNLLVPPSRCSACGKKISAVQNVPVLSYLFLGGKCGHCKTSYSARYPIVEGLTAVLAGIVAWQFGFGWEGIMGIVLTLFLVPITLIDFDHQLIPDSIVLPLLWIGLAMSLWHPMPGAATLFISSHDAIVGAIVGYLSLWSFYWLFKLVTGKEGMGYGDFKLLAALGAWLGVHYLFTIVIMSAVVGATLGIALIIFRGRDRQVPMPFGPFLAVAGWIVMLWGDELKAILHIPF